MKNYNFIYGNTFQGDHFVLDGFRVESYTKLEYNGKTFLEIHFKSGKTLNVARENEAEDMLDEEIDRCMNEDPAIINQSFGTNRIECFLPDESNFVFDGNAVEFVITKGSDNDWIELHFISGRTIIARMEVDEDIYPGDDLKTLVDDCICRYYNIEE